jgi:hypothetical protein
MFTCIFYVQFFAVARSPFLWNINLFFATEIASSDTVVIASNFFGSTSGLYFTDMDTRAWADIKELVSSTNSILVMLYDEDCITEITKMLEG